MHNSNGSHLKIENNFLLNLNKPKHHQIVLIRKSMKPYIAFLELCRIMLHLRQQFEKVVEQILNVILNLFFVHIEVMQLL
jgi:hypothetical protein